jgi:hypothetical protein
MISRTGLHYEILKSFNDDEKIIYLLNDSQGRLRDMMKNIYREFLKVKESGITYSKTSQVQLDEENGDSFKDKTKGLENYKNYLFKIIDNPNDLIKDELINIILEIVPAITKIQLVKTLQYIHKEHNDQSKSYINHYLDLIIVYTYNAMIHDYSVMNSMKELPMFLSTLKGYYQSSKSREPELLELRDLGNKLVKDSTDIKTRITVTSLRTANFLYLILRTFTKHHYN